MIPALEDTIMDTLKEFNNRQSYHGRGMIPPKYLPGLRSMLTLSVQNVMVKVLEAYESVANEPDESDLPELERTLNILKAVIAKHCIDATTSITADELWRVEDLFLVIDTNDMGAIALEVTANPDAE